jgi:hypothetical protein
MIGRYLYHLPKFKQMKFNKFLMTTIIPDTYSTIFPR